VRSLFETQASYTSDTIGLLTQWATELLPELEEPSVDDEEPLVLDGCPLFNNSSAPRTPPRPTPTPSHALSRPPTPSHALPRPPTGATPTPRSSSAPLTGRVA
jgi:hypothetical protein